MRRAAALRADEAGGVAVVHHDQRIEAIRKGADLPLLLIFAGVIGGLVAFGLVGIFIGPVVLAVTYTLLGAWMAERPVRSTATPDA